MKNASNSNYPLTGKSVLIVFASLTMFISLYFPNALAQDSSTYADWYHKGVDLHDKGDFNGSIAQFDKALAVDPNDVDALTSKGFALYDMGNHTGAIEYYDRALAVDPDNTDAINGKNDAQINLDQFR